VFVPKPRTSKYWSAEVKLSSFSTAGKECIVVDYKILCLGLIQSLFEGSMYTFVLEWTPALTPENLSSANVDVATSRMHCCRLQDPVPGTYPVSV